MRHQSRENSQLSRDKEQLQWKIQQRNKTDLHSKSFAGVSDKGNFKTFNILHSSVHPSLDDTNELLASSFSGKYLPSCHISILINDASEFRFVLYRDSCGGKQTAAKL